MTMSADVTEIFQDLPFSANAVVVLKRRYLKKDAKGEVAETSPDMFRRERKTTPPAAPVAPTASMIRA